jgi:5-amino-6-(5-phosphoribosylamino)uracil reductase
MRSRPHVLLSVAASLDGCLDDTSTDRLLLSNDEDFDRVDEVRAGVDAILVGANTIRADDPRLLVCSEARPRSR